jgi:hypothetical protein
MTGNSNGEVDDEEEKTAKTHLQFRKLQPFIAIALPFFFNSFQRYKTSPQPFWPYDIPALHW